MSIAEIQTAPQKTNELSSGETHLEAAARYHEEADELERTPDVPQIHVDAKRAIATYLEEQALAKGEIKKPSDNSSENPEA